MKKYNKKDPNQFDFTKKFLFHPEQIADYKRGLRPFPINLELDLTEACNHNCSFCNSAAYRGGRRDSIDTDILLERLKEAKDLGTKSISFTGGGEPMIHKDFLKIMEFCSEIGYDSGLITNGSAITKKNVHLLRKNLKWVRVSMAGGTRESYKKVQGIDHFDRVIRNLKMLASKEENNSLRVGVRMLVLPTNLRSVISMAESLKDTGIEYFQVAPDQYTKDGGSFWKSEEVKDVFQKTELILGEIKLLVAGYTIGSDRDVGCAVMVI